MLRYLDFVFSNNSVMPNPKKDINRISNLYSWCKHLDEFTVAYPLLIR